MIHNYYPLIIIILECSPHFGHFPQFAGRYKGTPWVRTVLAAASASWNTWRLGSNDKKGGVAEGKYAKIWKHDGKIWKHLGKYGKIMETYWNIWKKWKHMETYWKI